MTPGTAPTCPVCDAQCDGPPLHEFTPEQSAAVFCPPRQSADRYERLCRCVRRLWSGETARVFRCTNCGFGFGWPYVGGDEEFYSLLHEMAAYPRWRWDYDVAKGVIAKLDGKILDIGTGDGAFLKRLGRQWDTYAVEGSNTMRAYLRERGIQCFDNLKQAASEASASFTAVTMFQVLEHIAEFRDMLRACHDLLRPNGVLVVGVPLAEATFMQEVTTGCPDMVPNHINKWSPKALDLALRRAGFDPSAPRFEPGSLRLAAYRAWLRVRAQSSTRPHSLAARARAIQPRPLRVPLIAGLALFSLLGCLPRLGLMAQGHSFAMVGRKAGGP